MFDLNNPKYRSKLIRRLTKKRLCRIRLSFFTDHSNQMSGDVRHAYNVLREFVEKQLRASAYSIVDLTQLFSYLDSNWTKVKVLHDQEELGYILDLECFPSKIPRKKLNFHTQVMSVYTCVELMNKEFEEMCLRSKK